LKATAGKMNQRLLSFFSCGLIVGFTIIISLLNKTWSNPDGFPTGWDTYAHLTKIRYVLDFWPHSSWAYLWYMGTPIFRWYSPLPYYLTALFVRITGWTVEFALTFTFLIGIILAGVAVFLSVFELTEDSLASLIAAMLTLSSTIFWNYGLWIGMYSRYLATAMFSFFIFFLVKYLKQAYAGYQSKRSYFGLLAFLSLSVLSHPVTGIVTALTLLVAVFFCVEKWRRKIKELIKISLPAALLSGHFYLPFMIGTPELVVSGVAITQERESFTLPDIGYFLMGVRHKYPTPGMAGELSLLTVPIISLALFTLVRHGSWTNGVGKLSLRTALAFGFVSVFLVIYMILTGRTGWVFFLIFFLPLVCGILVHYATEFKKKVKFGKMLKALMLCGIILSVFSIIYPAKAFSLEIHERSVQNNFAFDVVQRVLTNESSGKIANYRFGIPSDPVAWWFNYKYPNIPQTRGYFGATTLYMDWFVWFESTVWGSTDGSNPASIAEIKFLLDWHAVEWFVMYPPYNYTKYSVVRNTFQEVTNKNDVHGFIYRNATPIVCATDVPSILVIGDKYYRDLMALLSYSDFDSRHAIPIHGGGNRIDDLSIEELSKFDVVILYGYQYGDRDKAWTLLQQYVQAGGGLIVDTGLQYANPDWNAQSIPTPCSVSATYWTNFGKAWKFTFTPSYITDGIDFSAFSPAISAGDPWNFAASDNSSVRSWARPVLWNHGHPVVVIGNYGNGRVVWTGMNLPWHINVYRNPEESKFFSRMIEWVSKSSERQSKIDYAVDRPNPETVTVTINKSSRNVLFKEYYIENWHAYIEGEKGTFETKIYRAGPMFMFIVIPKDSDYPIKVVFKYEPTIVESGSLLISALTFLLLVAYGLKNFSIAALLKKAHTLFLTRIEERWYKE